MSTTLVPTTKDLLPTFFDDFFGTLNDWQLGSLRRKATIPAVNVKETPKAYLLTMAVPGMKKEDFQIDTDALTLTIKAEQEEKKETKEEKSYREEYNYSSFSRSFSIPEDVNPQNIEASYTDGILHLTLPRKEKNNTTVTKQIAVK